MMRRSTLLAVLFLAMFVIGLDLYIVSPVLHDIALSFGVAPAQVGLLVTAFALPYGLLALVFGPVSDRVGRRPVLLTALPIFALSSVATALAPTFAILLIARVVAGAAAAAVSPSIYALVGDEFPPEQRPKAMGIVMMGLNLGSVLGVPLGGWLSLVASWRGVFWLVTALGVIAWPVLALRLSASQPSRGRGQSHMGAYAQALAVPGAPAALATTGLWYGMLFAYYTFMGELLYSRYHMGAAMAGLVLAGYGVAMVTGNLLAQPVVRRLGSARLTAMLGMAFSVAGVATIALGQGLPLWVMLLGLVVWPFGLGFGMPAHQTVVAGLSGAVRGTMLSLNSSATYLGIMAATALQSWVWLRGGALAAGGLTCLGFILAAVAETRVPNAPSTGGRTVTRQAV